MRSTQDRVATHNLLGEMALDNQGRVLRRPHFLTKREHDELLASSCNSYRRLLAAERAKTKLLTDTKIDSVLVVMRPQILVRKRLHWLVRRVIQVV